MAYTVKSLEQQASDRESLALYKRISKVEYFDQLQLITKLEGVDTYDAVNEADRVFSGLRELQLAKNPLQGEFTQERFLETHRYLFQDVYYFAGELRDLPMEIDSVTRFASPRFLEVKLPAFFEKLKSENYFRGLTKEQFVGKLANCLTDINILHPFREGNGRTKRVFFGDLSEAAGWRLDWSAASKEEWKMADECAFDSSRDGHRDTYYLKILLDKAVEPIHTTVQTTSPQINQPKEMPIERHLDLVLE